MSEINAVAGSVLLVGTGFVADLYMRSLATFPNISVLGAYDVNSVRLQTFCDYWSVARADSLEQLLHTRSQHPTIVLNLTNPSSHYEVSLACLNAGHHVYSEKPLALSLDQAQGLADVAMDKGLLLAGAPCSVLGESAQTLAYAIRQGLAGTTRLIYAELDDDFITQAPYRKWRSESGAPWPFEDEFRSGCTLEHAGYWLTWLIGIFGPVETVISAAANTIPEKLAGESTAPDYSSGTLYFASGIVARITCSIIARHNHKLRVYTDNGVLEVDRSWDNASPVSFRRRSTIRRRLFYFPFAKRIKLRSSTHPKVSKWGAAAMNFALGPADMLDAIREKRLPRLGSDFAVHLTEVTLALSSGNGLHEMKSSCKPVAPMPWASGQ